MTILSQGFLNILNNLQLDPNLKMYMSFFAIVVTLIAIRSAEIPKPQIHNQITNKFEFKVQSDSLASINFENIDYIINIQIRTRKNDPAMAIQQAIKLHANQFQNSKICKPNDPDFDFTRTFTIPLDEISQTINRYYFSQQTNILVIQTDIQLIVYKVLNLDFNQNPPKYAAQPLYLLGTIQYDNFFKQPQFERFFFQVNMQIFYSNGYQVYEIIVTSQSADIKQRKNLLMVDLLENQTAEIKQITVIPPETIFVLYQADYQMFILNNQTDQFEKLNYKEKPMIYQFSEGYFSDVDWSDDKLYLLNNLEGIVQISNYHPKKHNNKQTIQFYPFRFGEHLSFEIRGKLVQIVCEYDKQRFVAEMYINDKNKIKTMDINRFYNKIRGAISTRLFNSQLYIFGDEQISINGPGINRHILKQIGDKQYPYIFSSYDISYFEIIEKDSKNHHTTMIGISQNSVNVLTMVEKIMSLSCQAQKQSLQILANITGICCYKLQCEQYNQPIQRICNYQIPISLEVANEFHFKQALVITTSVIVVVGLICFAVLVGICKMMEVISKKHYIKVGQLQKLNKNSKSEELQQEKVPSQYASDLQLQNQFKKQSSQ